MLILTRKVGESVIIGDQFVVRVVDARGKHAKLGIEAPRDVAVHRQEVCEKPQQADDPDTPR
ncbi:MAG: carbon storage regulator CsrA [Pseudomonadota bacterium]